MCLSYHLSALCALGRSAWLIPNSQRHSHRHFLLFILHAQSGLPSASIPYRRFEMGLHFEASHMDSSSHNLGLAIFNHRLADHLGAVRRSALIDIFIRASHKLSLIFLCMSDSPYPLWDNRQPYSRHYALRLVAHVSYAELPQNQDPRRFLITEPRLMRLSYTSKSLAALQDEKPALTMPEKAFSGVNIGIN